MDGGVYWGVFGWRDDGWVVDGWVYLGVFGRGGGGGGGVVGGGGGGWMGGWSSLKGMDEVRDERWQSEGWMHRWMNKGIDRGLYPFIFF